MPNDEIKRTAYAIKLACQNLIEVVEVLEIDVTTARVDSLKQRCVDVTFLCEHYALYLKQKKENTNG